MERFRLVECLLRDKVTKNEGGLESVCLGEDFGIAVSQNGHAYTWGCGENGKLGHQEMNNKKQPKKISALRESEISLSGIVACGSEHVIGINRLTGELYSWGLNTSAQLGLGSQSSSTLGFPKYVNPFETTQNTRKTNELSDRRSCYNDVLRSITYSCSVRRTQSLQLWFEYERSTGFPVAEIKEDSETMFMMGMRQQSIESDFKLIDALNGKGVIQIEAGSNFSLCLTNDGYVYSFGQNSKGQLGLGKVTQHESRPRQIPSLKNITRIAAGQDHALALSVSGDVFSWGANQYGQLGQGNTVNLHTPKSIQGIPKIGRIFCGGNHTFVIESIDSSARKRKHSLSGQASSAEEVTLPPAIIQSALPPPQIDQLRPVGGMPSVLMPIPQSIQQPMQPLTIDQQAQQLVQPPISSSSSSSSGTMVPLIGTTSSSSSSSSSRALRSSPQPPSSS
eukprot:TRINITY_DN138_c0_g1_i3.p1 TRINITY_DN138_c0_g1~~TRINITY_DN138_c0_g1_i3.p1  ORF type:complete len:450 (+),score=83.49 TRINITY_DN138_c0_g1_i3:600-1949(+)